MGERVNVRQYYKSTLSGHWLVKRSINAVRLPWDLYVPEITIRVDESEGLSPGGAHDQETDRFLSTGTAGRRVSFNEAALFDHSKKTQEKGRRSAPRRLH